MIKGEFYKFITQNVLNIKNRTLHLEKERAKRASFLKFFNRTKCVAGGAHFDIKT